MVNTLLRREALDISSSKSKSTNPALTAREEFTKRLIPLISTLTSAENTKAVTLLIIQLIKRPNSVISLLDSKASKNYPGLVAIAKYFHQDPLHQKSTDGIKEHVSLMLRNVDHYLSKQPEQRQEIVKELSALITNLLIENAPDKTAEEKIINNFIKEINLELSKPPSTVSLIQTLLEVGAKYPKFFGNAVQDWQKLSTSFGQKIDLLVGLTGQALRTYEGVQKKLFGTS